MNKSTKSLLLAAMMAVSGFATAQTAAPTNDVKSGTQGGSGPSASDKAAPGSMPNSRAQVKSETVPMKSGIQGGEGASPATNPNTARTGAGMAGPGGTSEGIGMAKSRAEVKSEATPMKSGIQGGSGASPSTNPNTSMAGSSKMSSSGSKMTSAERREANKMRRANRAKSSAGQKEGKSAN